MIPLQSHKDFEYLYEPPAELPKLSAPVLISFSASWCGPCKKIDWQFILDEFTDLPVYRCDIDENKYTPGFCGIKSIPSVLMLFPGKKVIGPLQTSDTAKIATWIHTTLRQHS